MSLRKNVKFLAAIAMPLVATGLLLLGAGVANAQTTGTTPPSGGSAWHGRSGMTGLGNRGTVGTVTAISGTTLTVTSKARPNATAGTTGATYTVNAANATVTKSGAASSVSAIAVGDTVMVQGTVSGTSITATKINDGMMGNGRTMGGKTPGVFGTVTAINGNSITIASKMGAGESNGNATTYTVNAANATVTKSGAASSVSAIAVGDTIMVQGTVSGTSVSATTIRDGMPAGIPQGQTGTKTPAQSPIQGNGEPVVGGTITAISGSTLTVTNKSNVTYAVDASAATIVKGNATSSLASVSIGDNVLVQGTVNGTSVAASSVIDQGGTTNASAAHQGSGGGFFNAIGGFFHRLFGFF